MEELKAATHKVQTLAQTLGSTFWTQLTCGWQAAEKKIGLLSPVNRG